MTIKKRITTFLLVLVVILALGGELLLSLFAVKASAAEGTSTTYSNVLDDLTTSDNFSIENYPILTYEYVSKVNHDTDTTNDQPLMEVIQIAESSADELYIYVYQPTDSELELTASAVLLSTEFTPDGQNINPDIYYLELVSSDSVFDKYVVKNFQVSEEPYRYYNIVTLYRNFNSEIDEVTAGGVIENFELGIGVGQQWCAYYLNNSIVYEMNTFRTVDIDIVYPGSIEFSSGFTIGNILGNFDYGDAWFIVFDVEDYIVKKIYDADLKYKIRDKRASGNNVEYGDWSPDIEVALKEGDTATYQGDGLFAKEYTWNKICIATDFKIQLQEQGIKISDEMNKYLSESPENPLQKRWVFAFLQTEKEATALGTGSVYIKSSQVSAVTVVSLHFMDINGDVYNLGVVSDRVSPDDTPDSFGSGTDLKQIPDLLEKVLMIASLILLFIVLIFLFPFVRFILNLFWLGIKFIFNLLLWILTLPFKIIGFFFK